MKSLSNHALVVLLIGYLSIHCQASANEEIINVERSVSGNFNSSFPNPDNIQPDISDFKVINTVLMSNEQGERWAVVTLQNTARGQRTLNQNQLMALISSGERIVPERFKELFSSNETLSITLHFGQQKFPILEIFSRTM
ncbi:hypothetical protein [Shewanella waksmanii]|uniref:hypothetical protein n=1 Tax=Shewanella waksmanii TaxID=213783 RepID=UPI0004B61817|nr:hypothetical protein [Shewanella waksmanii]